MADVVFETPAFDGHPLDVVEHVVAAAGCIFERLDDDDIAAEVAGHGCLYRLVFTWFPARETLQLACAFDTKLPAARRGALLELLALVNERLHLGHFHVVSDQGLVTFRQGIPLGGGTRLADRQVTELIAVAVHECERFYPALQFVLWAGKSPEEAVAAAMLETVGTA